MTVTASKYARKANDLYQTEPWVTFALLAHLGHVRPMKVWDPAAGNHLMSDVIRQMGFRVVTSDIETYDRRHDMVKDFFDAKLPRGITALIANPPYGPGGRTAAQWARRSIDLLTGGWIALLLTAKFDSGRTRADLFRDCPRFHSKLVLLDRISWTLDGNTGTEDNAWYVWRPRGLKIVPPTIAYAERPREER